MQPFTFLALVSMASTAAAQACTATGTNVTVSGFVMDNFCIQRGNLVDNPSVITLKGPDVHTIHCLIDLTPCVESKYTLLAPPANGSDLYSVKYQLGDAGSALARAAARGARSLGGKTGFSVTVTGIDDGTPELKCVDISKTVIADGKTLTLAAIPASTGVSSLALPSVVAAVGAVIVAFAF
ncbi:hypothetical protein H310_05347 [Aphanomyces invadans]|uniref:Uncharacterized protein n=1 Tax=Aphanomyces invadans TaxID=157072 RepID=A0A024U9J9_9STRA|nr:hypothetical protein H310_05347 [Aphanomyces invadans]ETW02875.1 hypothetical protein H310_05347 [Aphanomyces invadans]|eukprot:XP_008868259.1 hypothetical protein H310_05347 [Aphanomyces invadans]